MESKVGSEGACSSYGISHQGKVRDHNEDNFLDLNTEGLWVVADGAGGHEKGEVASALIVEELAKFRHQDDLIDNVTWIVEVLRQVNQKLITLRDELVGGGLIGSTVSVLLIHENNMVCIWSGDSRIYLYRDNYLFLLTHDHNRKEEFFRAGFSEGELQNYPAANQLTKAVGATIPLGIDIQLYESRKNDCYLICSDGLSGELDDNQIIENLETSGDVEKISSALINTCLEQRARDNVTAVVVKS